jgi:GNAT superfamily N-acetyltransferase
VRCLGVSLTPSPDGDTDWVEFEVVTCSDRPDLDDAAAAAFRERWPEFVFHDVLSKQYMQRVDDYFGQFSVFVLHDGQVAAGGWGVPLVWDGTSEGLPEGYRTAMVASVEDHEAGRSVNTLSFMAAAVATQFDKQGLAARVLEALSDRASEAGLAHVVAPLRPTLKHRYPQVAMSDYMTWVREDGLSIDPWIRTHQRMGAAIITPAPDSMVVRGTVAEWERWAGMVFPASGSYVVPDALNLVEVDREHDRAVYREENLWVQHR